jgi:GNAT superfamily N-acetyltransferase
MQAETVGHEGGFREAQGDEAEFVARLINEAYGPAVGFLYDGPRIAAGEVLEKLAQGKFLLECGADETIHGCVYVEISGDCGYFGLLAVLPAYQGRGIARSLINEAESFCRRHGCRTMELGGVNHRNELLSFYARAGYAATGEKPFLFERLRMPSHIVVMRKVLVVNDA